MYRCPGCRCEHSFRVAGLSPRYVFNGDLERPTIVPALIFDWGSGRCVSTITDGEVEFSIDSTHKLAGRKLALEPIPQ